MNQGSGDMTYRGCWDGAMCGMLPRHHVKGFAKQKETWEIMGNHGNGALQMWM
jgi:hypothetical protein